MKPRYKVTLIEERGGHFYNVGRKKTMWPGITGILSAVIAKPYLVGWAAKKAAENIKRYLKANAVDRPLTAAEIDELVETGRKAHETIRDQAANLGTRAHYYIDCSLNKRELPELTDDITPCINAFQVWQDHYSFEIVMGDTKVASKRYRYGGSLDLLAKDRDGRLGIIDLKTSNQISPEYKYQVAAYARAFEETYGERIYWAMILRLGKKTPEFEAAPIDLKKAIKGLKHVLGLYRDGR